MAPRRPPQGANSHSNHSHHSQTATTPARGTPRRHEESTASSAAPTPMMMPMPSAAVMSDETRYEQNLKVVRRRDPSILRIFDQFPHVTVYEYLYEQEPPRWEKYGCEGTMFLFERDIEPRYGFYVLNRSGMHDYVHPIYPWDDIQRSKPYLLFCSYPDYTSAVLAGKPLPLAPPTEPPGPHAARKAFRKSIIGLWTSEKETHGASMAPAIIRLHSCIQSGQDYPAEFKYEFGRRPQATLQSPSLINASATRAQAGSPFKHTSSPSMSSAQPVQNLSILNKLFANASSNGNGQSSTSTPTPQSPTTARRHQPAPSASTLPNLAPQPQPTLDALFASVKATPQPQPLPVSQPPVPVPAIPQTNNIPGPAGQPAGLALLGSIFASAGLTSAATGVASPSYANPSTNGNGYGSPSQPWQQQQSQPQPQSQPQHYQPQQQSQQPQYSQQPPLPQSRPAGEMNAAFRFPNPHGPQSPDQARSMPAQAQAPAPAILSPKPTMSGLPPLLSNTIMGYGAGGGAGGAGSRTSSTTPSDQSYGQSRSPPHSGRGGSAFGLNGGYVLDEDAEERSAATNERMNRSAQGMNADATPRAGLSVLPPVGAGVMGPSLLQQMFSAAQISGSHPLVSTVSAAASEPLPETMTSPRTAAALADTSVLWPTDGTDSANVSEEVIELDFSDTRALADPAAFKSAQAKAKKSTKKAQSQAQAQPQQVVQPASASPVRAAPVQVHAPPSAISAAGAVPVAQPSAGAMQPPPKQQPSSLASPPTSPMMMFVPAQVRQPAKAHPNMLNGVNGVNGMNGVNGVNGFHAPHQSLSLPNGHSPMVSPMMAHQLQAQGQGQFQAQGHAPTIDGLSFVNGHVPLGLVNGPFNQVNGPLSHDALRASVDKTLGSPNRSIPPGLERDHFARHLHRLIDYDPHFLTALWQDYQARSGVML